MSQDLSSKIEKTLAALVPSDLRHPSPLSVRPPDEALRLLNQGQVAALIDHTLLKAEATEADIATLCEQAAAYGFASVCVNPWNVPQAFAFLADTSVKVCTVIGFPLGASRSPIKQAEAADAIQMGAREVDMVISIGALRFARYDLVFADIQAVSQIAHQGGALCKVIIETALLSEEEKIAACLLAKWAGADFVKTSTGFSSGGATLADVALMRQVVGLSVGVKASGGVRSLADVQAMVQAGATRIGASAGVQIVEQALGENSAAAKDGY